jgi:UDP-N-acetyl-D-glucosamine dehydrogenase
MSSQFQSATSINYQKDLRIKINNKEAVIGIIGLGYVGLPLAVESAVSGFKVIGFDLNAEKVDSIKNGVSYIEGVSNKKISTLIKDEKLLASTDLKLIEKTDVVIICVPTPLDEHHQPDITYIENATKEIAKYMKEGTLVILESTTYPGTTEEVVKPLLETSGLKCGEQFFLAYSPERIDPGNKTFNTKNTPKVVGGINNESTEIAGTFYQNVLDAEIFKVSSPAVAEMEKILENTFRNINIALVNELAIICNKMNIDVWEVIDAAKTKPYGFMPFYPGPGLGGHCIPIDPFYLTWKAREYNHYTRMIEVAGEINNNMPNYVVERIGSILNDELKSIKGSTVLLLGIAYKKDVKDYRESAILKIIEILESAGALIKYCDPYIPYFIHRNKKYVQTELNMETLQKADIVVITTDHSNFDYELVGKYANVIYDTRNVMRNHFKANRYITL